MNIFCIIYRIVVFYLEIECVKFEIYILVDDGELILMFKLLCDDLFLICGVLIWEGKMLGCNVKFCD